MLINLLINKEPANERINKHITEYRLEAKSDDFCVWYDTCAKIYVCKDRRIECDRDVWHEVEFMAEIKKSDLENWNFPNKDHEGAFKVSIQDCEVIGEHTSPDGVVYVKFFRFKHVYDIHAYVRSCSRNDDSIEKQKKIIEEYCNKYLPYSSISWHVDNGCDGNSNFFMRNAALDMYDSMSDKESHVVIVSDLSRISRNIETTRRTIEELINDNCRFISIREEVDFV